jgi:hypothetical protein
MTTTLANIAALSIINSVANPALKYQTQNCNAKNLAAIIATAIAPDNLLEVLEIVLPLAHKERDRLTRKINEWSGDEDLQAADACAKAAAIIAKARGLA